jgi:PQQ-dependent catabolism-associated CXXCW motif protein
MNTNAILGLTVFLPAVAGAQIGLPAVQPRSVSFAFEDVDWGVPPTRVPRDEAYHAPTPSTIPGARVIRTLDLKALLDSDRRVVVVDVIGGAGRRTVPGAWGFPGFGAGSFSPDDRYYYALALEIVTSGDKNRPLVFLCVSSECWLSYNAALHAVEFGYRDVIWFRGGSEAWRAASLPMAAPLGAE